MDEKRQTLDEILDTINAALKNAGASPDLFAAFTRALPAECSYAQLLKADRILGKFLLSPSFSPPTAGLREVRIALLGNFTLDHLAPALRVHLLRYGLLARLYTCPYASMEAVVLDPASEYYAFKPDVTLLYTSFRDLQRFPGIADDEPKIAALADDVVSHLENLWRAVAEHSGSFIIQNNFETPFERVFGNLDRTLAAGRTSFVIRVNERLYRAAARHPSVAVNDLDHVSSVVGKREWFDERFWYHSQHPHSIEHAGEAAKSVAAVVASLKGAAKKCVVLDLDNTLWGGAVGEEGLENIVLDVSGPGRAYYDFQRYLRTLKERGVLLAVCSKNDEATAREVFEKHPHAALTLDDFVCFTANWDNKAGNVAAIARSLDIGMDALVFVDDEPAERDMVRTLCPGVHVVELPEDPSEFIRALDAARLFEPLVLSPEDARRTGQYRENRQREEAAAACAGIDEYLKSLRMQGNVRAFDEENLPRIVQLIGKTNQFNLTTPRYHGEQVRQFMNDPRYVTRALRLADKFGDYGLVSVLIARQEQDALHIEAWLMSCRVLNKGAEYFMFDRLLAYARGRNVQRIIGRYVPTQKNAIVRDLYPRLGFKTATSEPDGSAMFTLDCRDFRVPPFFIEGPDA